MAVLGEHKGSASLLSAVQESECHIHPARVWLEGLKNRGEGAMSKGLLGLSLVLLCHPIPQKMCVIQSALVCQHLEAVGCEKQA